MSNPLTPNFIKILRLKSSVSVVVPSETRVQTEVVSGLKKIIQENGNSFFEGHFLYE